MKWQFSTSLEPQLKIPLKVLFEAKDMKSLCKNTSTIFMSSELACTSFEIPTLKNLGAHDYRAYLSFFDIKETSEFSGGII